ncbi:MAG: hypothetical protein AAF663_07560 [Planctomycetota bacterium]
MKLHEADDAINTLLKSAVDGFAPPSGWATPVVYWPGVTPGDPTPDQRDDNGDYGLWVEFGIRPNTGGIACVGGSPGANKYRRGGVYVAMVNALASAPRSVETCSMLCEAVIDGFDLAEGSVWFRNNRFMEGAGDGFQSPWYRRVVTGEYLFDDSK